MTNSTVYNGEGAINIDTALAMLTSFSPELKDRWERYKSEEYDNYQEERLDHVDIGQIVQYIVDKTNANQTDNFDIFFEKVETVIDKGDDNAVNLIVIGLLEGIQNKCGWENIDYYKNFDNWLKPKTKETWNKLIHFWESDESKQKWDEPNKTKDSE